MAEIKTELKTYRVEYICDECKEGKMKFSGVELLTYQAQYPHICDKCGKKQDFFKIYPKIAYEEKEGICL